MDGSGEQPSVPASAVRAKSKFLPFKHALLHARSLKLKGRSEWRAVVQER